MSKMIRIIYISQAVKPFSTGELMDLLRQARRHNASRQITGVLLYYNECFVQVLEGEEEIVDQTLKMIRQDPRHTHVTILERTTIQQRQFTGWNMGFEELDSTQLNALHIDGITDFFIHPPQFLREKDTQRLIEPLMSFFRKSYQLRQNQQGEELPIHNDQQPILVYCHKSIRFAVAVLAVLMSFVIILGVFDVMYVIYEKLINPPFFLLNIQETLATFGAFLAVLIAIEIFLNISLYLRSDVIPIKLVIATALMAISRKVIVFDFKIIEADYIYASSAVIIALGITYWLLNKNDEKH